MAEKTWNEFFFGTEEDRKRAREVLKEMRPDYQRPGEKMPEKKAVIDRRPPFTSEQARKAKVARPVRKEEKPPHAGAKPVKAKKAVSDEYVQNFKDKLQGQRPGKKKPVAKPVAKVGFKGNWVGAAPTEMQKRGGARIKKKATLMGYLKKKRSS